ncbi:hypothetical protein V8E53_012933 [Lactarius tabidus]
MPGSPIVDIRNSFGAAFIGLLVSTTLFGLTIVQTWIYFWKYRNRDRKSLKFFIAYISYLVLNFGNPENLASSIWALDAQVIIGLLRKTSLRSCRPVSKSMVCLVIILALVVVVFAFNLSFHKLSLLDSMSTGALLDMLIAAAMCWSLFRRRTGFARQAHPVEIYAVLTTMHRTDSIITTLMAYSVNSGLLTSLLAAATAISFIVSSKLSLIWLAIYWVMCKCYVNSLLAMLNSRDYVRDRSASSNPDNASSCLRSELINRVMATELNTDNLMTLSLMQVLPPFKAKVKLHESSG